MTYTLDESHTSRNFTPAANVLATFGYPRDIKWITIHHWGDNGQQFDIVRDYLCTNTTPTSAHFVAEGGQVACIVSPEDAAWHAGNARGNAQSIGIECRPEHTDADYQTVGDLVAWLRSQYGDLPLVPHNYWTSTACPGDYDLTRIDAIARGGTVTAQSGTITPITQDWTDMATQAEVQAACETAVANQLANMKWVVGGRSLFDFGTQTLNSLDTISTQLKAVENIPLGLLTARFQKKDGTVTSVAAALSDLLAKPATVTNQPATSPAFDTDAFIARLVATLPAATVAAIKNAL